MEDTGSSEGTRVRICPICVGRGERAAVSASFLVGEWGSSLQKPTGVSEREVELQAGESGLFL